MTNQYFEEWYTEFITPRGYLLETRGIKSFLKEAWDAGAASQQAEPRADPNEVFIGIENVARWLENGCDGAHAARELRQIAAKVRPL